MTDDQQLLATYAAEVSEEAFAELAHRYTALVYSAAFRQVRDPQMAQDVTQVVFANLARRARAIPSGTILAGWLHRDTRYTALQRLRELMAKRGTATTAAALSRALTAHAVETVPAGFVVSLTTGSAAVTAAGAGGWILNLILT